ncbi:heavy metal translocating P-type ATPase [Bradyrhizobium betae]|uniref:P-type Zn(2+) transporter n=1 Tax=Bradyrhizobium betae TaxID=244734 RepID=A0A5P6P4L0_9BRAD|nr:heavy metal translocating P-type ATPase [Bradyrhizobium betae]MCS3731161.1 heavy metal translocating P-type ATPase [Bradyrhizobium betae]QFI73126.1 cadmium-translocating P-type ATPase [Bradyrhizobium betae]
MLAGFLVRALLVVLPAFGLAFGFAIPLLGQAAWQDRVWAIFTIPVLIVLVYDIVTSLRRGEVGLDIVAALSMVAALVVGEELAAIVVALMYAGGQFLEAFAERHARGEMTALLARVPRTAVQYRDGGLQEVALDLIAPGDRLLIRQGDVVPVDGVVASTLAVLDQSALTGEPIPVQQHAGDEAMSGSTNAGDAFDLVVSRRAAESTYAGIVRLVEGAQRSKAPMSRLADRFAMVFLAMTVLIAAAAWFFTGDPVRAVAVLVIATPCPLILAVPVAIVSGLSRAARHGILIKGGKAIEALARINSLVLDKTGTLTDGRAKVVAVNVSANADPDDVLRLAASLDQASKHIIAQTIVAEAQSRQLKLTIPSSVAETPGEGVQGVVEGQSVAVGGVRFVTSKLTQAVEDSVQPSRDAGAATVAVAIDGRMAGEIRLADELRSGTQSLLQRLRTLGVQRIVLATGDRREVAEAITAGLDIDSVRAGLTPDQKVLVVLSERKNGPVMMVGDGVNDAPALAAADVGVAMGARGAAASAEAADVVILVDHLDHIVPAIEIARRSRFIALEGVFAGMGLSVIGMVAAALGYLTPVQGALIQEAIDVAVIVNALRALGGR